MTAPELLQSVPVYDVRLVRARKPLRLAESTCDHALAAARTLHALIGMTDREHFVALFLNAHHAIVGAHVVGIGATSRIATIEPRTVFRAAIVACAGGIVIGHNHPSGDPTPSDDDVSTTRTLCEAGKVLGVPVLDHVIVTHRVPEPYQGRSWVSLLSRGLMGGAT